MGGAPMTAAYHLFDTAIGRCGIAWQGDAVAAFALPGAGDAETLRSLLRRCPDAAPGEPDDFVAAVIGDVRRLLSGEKLDLSDVPVDLSMLSDFEQRALAALRRVGHGETVTYGELAARLGAPGAAQAVGAAMGRNPVPVIIPCHRVLAGGGRSGGFSAPGGVTAKFRLLQIEQAGRSGERLLFDTLPLAVKDRP
jgi:methylated-DNA-[protein]-cysteine S-methyltransferase